MSSQMIVCYKCKRPGPRSANNYAYCVECEAEVRRAYEKRNNCPWCGSAGERRGTIHWSGKDDRGNPCGGFDDAWFCHLCQRSYVSTR